MTMLRNDLITLLSQHDNDTVTVNVNGTLVDIAAVTNADGCIVIILGRDETPPSPRSEETPSHSPTPTRVLRKQ